MNHDALVKYFTVVADAIKIPLLIYNVPKFTGIDIQARTVALLAKHPNIVGIKNSTMNITNIAECVYLTPNDFTVLVGTGSILYPGLCVGAKGGVCALANIAPRQLVRIYEHYSQRNFDEALKLQQQMIAPNTAVTTKYGVAGLKIAMDMLGYYGGDPRLPLLPLDEGGRSFISNILKDCEIN
eukprot:TRINITY_DN6893_c0_g1_i3.p1 TRINITY_DN6893_c0_g1~~TRINITY_DN6893_c0_g1_i3.p1  ORF type:complete len:183 (-),score=31.23 TRINITY_DN6893_c0_g1_i3:102-650(-)